jgi:uncharacterized protein
MRFSLIPREMRFFDMLDEATATIAHAADKFCEMLKQYDNLNERARVLKAEEEQCDKIIERIITALDLSFITPFDREDIHTLATKMDDILDNLEETAHRFAVFRVAKPTQSMAGTPNSEVSAEHQQAIALAQHIAACCGHLQEAIRLLRNLKNSEEIYRHLREIGRLENEADTIYRTADEALFAHGSPDILALIKWREIYSWLEETVDACKDVANVISEIVIKGS